MSVTEAPGASQGTEGEDGRRAIVALLTQAYWMEIETVRSYLAASISHDGGPGQAVREALAKGVEEEVRHARTLGRRIHELGGVLAGAEGFASDEAYTQPLARRADIGAIIEAVVAAETSAIRHYLRIMRLTASVDEDTHALALEILCDEQRHLHLFEGYLLQYVDER
jgi:bacterioferritin